MTSSDFEPDLVPELLVSEVSASLEFWCELCGFAIAYERPDEGFAYVTQGSAHLMLEQRGIGRNWVTGDLEPPFGRGVNLQIGVPDLDPILSALRRVEWPLFMGPETRWYRVGEDEEAGVRQFLVTDPDGYLVRFQASLGRRAVASGRPVELRGRLICADAAETSIVVQHLPRHVELTLAEPGCLSFEVQPTDDPLIWTVVERFTDEEAFAAHQARVRASEWGRVTEGITRDYEIT